MTTALLRVAQGFALIFWGLLAWIVLWTGLVQIPGLTRIGLPVSTLPALLWLAGAWLMYRNPPLTRAWKTICGLFLAAAVLQTYMLPYLGWWHSAAPNSYKYLNIALLVLSCAGGVVLVHAIALQVARRLHDQVLHMEAHLSLAGIAVIAVILFGLFYWSTRRISDEIDWRDWIFLLYNSSTSARTTVGLIFLMPLLPPVALAWETRQRILAWLPARRFTDEQA